MTHNPSPEQLAIRDALTGSTDNLMIVAAAGSGKTTTGVWLLNEHTPPFANVLALAFNRHIDAELERRLHPRISHSTFNALGNAACRRAFNHKKIDADKCKWLFKDNVAPSERDFFRYVGPVTRLVSLAKNIGIGPLVPDTTASWDALLDAADLSFDGDADTLLGYAAATLRASNDDTKRLDFDDQLYLPVLRNLPLDPRDIVMIDEAQDVNAVQIALLERLLAVSEHEVRQAHLPRLLAFGDPSQAIYGFRGADADAMRKLRDRFSMTVLPLSVSYRCSRAVVAEAQQFCTNL